MSKKSRTKQRVQKQPTKSSAVFDKYALNITDIKRDLVKVAGFTVLSVVAVVVLKAVLLRQ